MKLKNMILIFSIAILASACIIVEPCDNTTVNATPDLQGEYDLTQTDVFALLKEGSIKSDQVSVGGVSLGGGFSDVSDSFGLPYSLEEYEGGIVNARYVEPNTNLTTLIFHLENNSITRIVVRSPFNDNLHGDTVIDMKKDDMTAFFGKPDSFEDATSLVTYYFNDMGLEMYLKRKNVIGFGLVPPK